MGDLSPRREMCKFFSSADGGTQFCANLQIEESLKLKQTAPLLCVSRELGIVKVVVRMAKENVASNNLPSAGTTLPLSNFLAVTVNRNIHRLISRTSPESFSPKATPLRGQDDEQLSGYPCCI